MEERQTPLFAFFPLTAPAEAVQESSGSFESTPFLDSHGSNESE